MPSIESFTRRVIRHRKAVALAWVALTVVGMALAGPASDAMEQEFSMPGGEGYETNVEIEQNYAAPAATSSRSWSGRGW